MTERPIALLFLWHMHQPFYKDAQNGSYLMPWVRLHATKGYYDIPQVMARYGIKGCVNVVPSLIEQIEDHLQDRVTDRWKTLTIKRPEEMNEEERAFVIRNFFMLCWDRLVKTSPRYWEILSKRERFVGKLSWTEMTRFFSDDELRDLQVLFNLKWFGFTARERYPLLRKLDEKDRGFTHDEKMDLLRTQETILREILPLYRRLADEGTIELSFTPFYHPILPLIHDTDTARRSSPHAPLPPRFSYPDDARWQVGEGKRYAEKVWQRELAGMWPAEGAVSPEAATLAATCGVKWLATDEGILFRSIGAVDKKQVLYRPWLFREGDRECALFFRDKYLSDLIGFSFAKAESGQAVESFLNHVRSIRHAVPDTGQPAAITVALDGENAWENYPDNGRDFLHGLCGALADAPDIVTETFSGFMAANPSETYPTLSTLHSGSWIQSDYQIWIGNDEDNTAWEHLRRTRLFLDDHLKTRPETPPETREEALRAIYRAEGSDWFWWYGPQFQTENDYLFDRLFRRHLRRVYAVLGAPHPAALDLPIKRSAGVTDNLTLPITTISPALTGRTDDFYGWAGAGLFDNTRRPGGVMYHGVRVVDRIWFGFDRDHLYFRVALAAPPVTQEHKRSVIRFYLTDGTSLDIQLPIARFEKTSFPVSLNNETGRLSELVDAGTAAFFDVLDLRLSIDKCGLSRGGAVSFHGKIIASDGMECERIPEIGTIPIPVPDRRATMRFWDV